MVFGQFPPGHSPRMNRSINRPNCRKSNFCLRTAVFSSIPLSFQQRTCFVKCKGRLDQFLGLLFRHYFMFSLHRQDSSLLTNCFINPASTCILTSKYLGVRKFRSRKESSSV